MNIIRRYFFNTNNLILLITVSMISFGLNDNLRDYIGRLGFSFLILSFLRAAYYKLEIK